MGLHAQSIGIGATVMSTKERHLREHKARRTAILMAAARVFARYGWDRVTIEIVAREAEVAVGTIYLYFSSQDDLYLNLVVELILQLRSRYVEIQGRGLDPLEEVRAIAAAYLDHLRNSREIGLRFQSVNFSQRFRGSKELRTFKRMMDLSQEVFQLWQRTVERCFDAGTIENSIGPKRTAAVIWAMLNGASTLLGNEELFRKISGMDAGDFLDDVKVSAGVGPSLKPSKIQRVAVLDVRPKHRARKGRRAGFER